MTPFGKGGRSVDFEVPAVVKMMFLVEMVVDRSVKAPERWLRSVRFKVKIDSVVPGHREDDRHDRF